MDKLKNVGNYFYFRNKCALAALMAAAFGLAGCQTAKDRPSTARQPGVQSRSAAAPAAIRPPAQVEARGTGTVRATAPQSSQYANLPSAPVYTIPAGEDIFRRMTAQLLFGGTATLGRGMGYAAREWLSGRLSEVSMHRDDVATVLDQVDQAGTKLGSLSSSLGVFGAYAVSISNALHTMAMQGGRVSHLGSIAAAAVMDDGGTASARMERLRRLEAELRSPE